MGETGMYIGYWWESQKEDKDVGGWTGLIWLRIETSGGLL
jgi:hypothetical protein